MAVGVPTNVFGGPVEVWVGPVGATEPTADDLDTLDVAWKTPGFTTGGVRQTVNRELTAYEVDQVPMPVGYRLRSRSITVATTLAEGTLDNMALAQGEATSQVTTSGTGKSYELAPDDVTAEPLYSAVLLRGPGPNGKTRVAVYRKCLPAEGVQTENNKTDATGIPVTWNACHVSDSVRPFRIIESPDPA
jgi:hypothetical protein